jgi:hypothetical protein
MFKLLFGKYLTVILITFAVSCTGLVYWYYTSMQNKITRLTENNAQLTTAVQTSTLAINALKVDYAVSKEETERLYVEFAAAQARTKVLEDKLSRHDIGVLAVAKPGLVEKIINNATNDTARCLAILSGSPLTEDEINATKKSQTNTSCPHIANPNYIIAD